MATSRQQQQQRRERSTTPEGDALAIINYTNKDGETDSRMFELGPVWRSENGNLHFRFEAFPLAWLDTTQSRTIVIKMRGDK